MNPTKMIETLQESLGSPSLDVIKAVGILIVGWLVALAIRAGEREGLKVFQVNQRLRATTGTQMDVEGGIAMTLNGNEPSINLP